MRRSAGFLLGALLVLARPAGAQTATVYLSRPNCHVFAPHVDQPFDHTHSFTQPAIAWDAEAAGLSLGTGMLLKHLGAPWWVAGALPTIGFGLVPHLIGWRTGRYNIDVAHWTFVLVNRATPAVWAVAHRDDSTHTVWTTHAKAAALWLAADASLSCFDR